MATSLFGGHAQYQSAVDGEAADAWLTDWVETNVEHIVSGSHELVVLDPPHEEGCVRQLNMAYLLEGETYWVCQQLASDVNSAVYDGGVAQADCDSSFWSSRPSESNRP